MQATEIFNKLLLKLFPPPCLIGPWNILQAQVQDKVEWSIRRQKIKSILMQEMVKLYRAIERDGIQYQCSYKYRHKSNSNYNKKAIVFFSFRSFQQTLVYKKEININRIIIYLGIRFWCFAWAESFAFPYWVFPRFLQFPYTCIYINIYSTVQKFWITWKFPYLTTVHQGLHLLFSFLVRTSLCCSIKGVGHSMVSSYHEEKENSFFLSIWACKQTHNFTSDAPDTKLTWRMPLLLLP